MPEPFELIYAENIPEHLRAIEPQYRSLIRHTIERQLAFEASVEMPNRKPLTRPSRFGPAWELRFGPGNRFRVFYRVQSAAREVHVLAIGTKVGNRLCIAGQEWEP